MGVRLSIFSVPFKIRLTAEPHLSADRQEERKGFTFSIFPSALFAMNALFLASRREVHYRELDLWTEQNPRAT